MSMTPLELLSIFGPLDAVALGLLILGAWAMGWRIEHPGAARPSVTALMADYRRDWMREFVARDVRIFDSQILAMLRQGTTFFASSALLATGAVLALVGNTDPLTGLAEGVGAQPSDFEFQIKLGLVVGFLVTSFLRFVWASRVFGYCAVVMASAPNDGSGPEGARRAAAAAELNIRAAINFNRGLRAMYFALASVSWLLGPIPLMVATAVTLWVLWGREFASTPRAVLMSEK